MASWNSIALLGFTVALTVAVLIRGRQVQGLNKDLAEARARLLALTGDQGRESLKTREME